MSAATNRWAAGMAEQLLHPVPILRIFSVETAKEFYIDFLGFRVDWEHEFDPTSPVYMQVSRGSCVLHLSTNHGDCRPGSTVFVRMTGLDDYHREITAKGYRLMRPGVEITPYPKCIEVIDPFGNRIRFNEDLAPPGG